MSNGRLCDQDFEELRAAALESGELFEDPEFPPDDQSLFFSKDPPYAFEWKRASEICDNPRLFEGGASRFDINQVTNNSFCCEWKIMYRMLHQIDQHRTYSYRESLGIAGYLRHWQI